MFLSGYLVQSPEGNYVGRFRFELDPSTPGKATFALMRSLWIDGQNLADHSAELEQKVG